MADIVGLESAEEKDQRREATHPRRSKGTVILEERKISRQDGRSLQGRRGRRGLTRGENPG